MCRVRPQKLNHCENGDKKRKGRGIVVDGGYYCFPNGGLKSGVDNVMLASQEIQGPPTPGKIHGSSIIAAKREEKEEEKNEQQQQQGPRKKSSILLFTTHIKPRLRWTPKLHVRFVDAINELGGVQKATPKAVQVAMAVEGLSLYHVKSHLQKYRMGKVTVREWPEVPKRRQRIGTSMRSLPFQAYGPRGYKLKKTYKVKKEVWAHIFAKFQEANYRQYLDKLIQEAEKKLDAIQNGRADADVAGSFQQDLVGERTMVETPSYYIQESTYPVHNTLDKIKDCMGLQNQISSSASYQLQDVAQSATRSFVTSQGNSYLEQMSSDAINVHAGLQEQTPSFLVQNETWGAVSGFQPNTVAYEIQPQNASYPSTNHFPTSNGNSSESVAYVQDFHTQSAGYSVQPQDASYYYQTQFAATGYPPQDAAHGYQVSNAAYSVTSDSRSSNRNFSETAYLDGLTAALAVIGSTNLASLLDDPVDEAYMDRNNPETYDQDNGLSFTNLFGNMGNTI